MVSCVGGAAVARREAMPLHHLRQMAADGDLYQADGERLIDMAREVTNVRRRCHARHR